MAADKNISNTVVTDHSVERILHGTHGKLKTLQDIPLPVPRRRYRRGPTVFSVSQKEGLDAAFENDMYPDVNARERLAEELGVAESRIQVWFQNRRSRLRRAIKMKFQPASRRGAPIPVTTQPDPSTFTSESQLYNPYMNPANQFVPLCTPAYWSPVLHSMPVAYHLPPQASYCTFPNWALTMDHRGTDHLSTLPVTDTLRAAETRLADMTSSAAAFSSSDSCLVSSTVP